MKHMIWNNTEWLEEDFHDIMNNLDQYDIEPGDESSAWELAHEWNDENLQDETTNLNVEVGTIIVFANLGLWNGRHTAYKTLKSGNLKDCLSVCCGDYIEWFVDDSGDVIVRDTHHDGTNVYTFRALRKLTDTQIENFYDKLDYEGVDSKTIKRYTRRLGDYVANVYGWKIKGGLHLQEGV